MGVKAAKIEEREQSIIRALKGKPDINERILERIKEQKLMSKMTYYNIRNKLVKAEKIIRENLGRQVWLYLPEDEALFRKNARRGERGPVEKDVEDKEKLRFRIAHTNDIKEKVIKPWLERLKPSQDLIILHYKDDFSGESEPLFSDFKKHIKFKPDPFDEGEIIRELDKEFNKKRRDLEYRILSIISQELEESPAAFTTESSRIKNVVGFGDEYDEARLSVCRWITDLMDERRLYSDDVEAFDEMYLDFRSYVKENESMYEYYVNDIYCGYIGKANTSKNKFKVEMDKCIKKILKRVTELEHFEEEIESLNEIKKLIKKHMYNIRESLEKHLRLKILPGDCEYYYWV